MVAQLPFRPNARIVSLFDTSFDGSFWISTMILKPLSLLNPPYVWYAHRPKIGLARVHLDWDETMSVV
jgi:hypothetical protein